MKEKSKELQDLNTKYLKILTTEPQREVIMRAIKKVMAKEGVKEGRSLELVCLDFLAGN